MEFWRKHNISNAPKQYFNKVLHSTAQYSDTPYLSIPMLGGAYSELSQSGSRCSYWREDGDGNRLLAFISISNHRIR